MEAFAGLTAYILHQTHPFGQLIGTRMQRSLLTGPTVSAWKPDATVSRAESRFQFSPGPAHPISSPSGTSGCFPEAWQAFL